MHFMFRLEYPEALYLFLLIPLWIFWNYWDAKSNKQKGSHSILQSSLTKLASHLPNKKNSTILFFMAIFFVTIAWANPQMGTKKERVQVEKSDIYLALDISQSMQGTDISPTRLEKAKRFITQLVNARQGDRIGLIFFAGSAFVQMPLTNDYAAAEMFVRSADPSLSATQGTVIGDAIDLALQNIVDESPKSLIIISDGEDHDENALKKATQAARSGWQIFTIGVGTENGSFIPILNQGREEYKTDNEGNPVKSIPNFDLLKKVAVQGNGQFFDIEENNIKIINDLSTYLDRLKKRSFELRSYTEYNSFYQYFLVPAFVFLLGWIVFPYGYFKI